MAKRKCGETINMQRNMEGAGGDSHVSWLSLNSSTRLRVGVQNLVKLTNPNRFNSILLDKSIVIGLDCI